jgi:hypothetical protein
MMSELEQVVDRGDRGRLWFLIAIGVLCVGIAASVAYAIVINVKQGDRLAKIESPCQKYGSDSKQCEEAFSLAVSTITHPQACAVERKAGTLRAIRELADELGVDFSEPCAGARIAQERERGNDRAAARRKASSGGDALQPGSTDTKQPSPSPSGGGGSIGNGAGKGGHEGGHAQGHPGERNQAQTSPAPTSQADSGSASADTPADVPAPAGEPIQLAPSPLPEAVEAAGGAVEKAGDAAQGVVEGTGKAAGCVLRGSC